MAEHAQAQPEMDYAEHERTYRGFTAFVEVGVLVVLNIVLVIAVWGLKGANVGALIGFILTLVTAAISFASTKIATRAAIALLLVLLASLALVH